MDRDLPDEISDPDDLESETLRRQRRFDEVLRGFIYQQPGI